MPSLIANSTEQETSADFTLAHGEAATLYLTSDFGPQVAPSAIAWVQIKSDSGEYFTIGELNCREVAKVLSGAGTYRISCPKSPDAFGVDMV